MDILTQIKTITKQTDETLINLLIDKTKIEICSYCKTNYIASMENLVADIVIFKLNVIGTEGISAQSYNGVSETYTNDYPIHIKMQLNNFRKKVYFL